MRHIEHSQNMREICKSSVSVLPRTFTMRECSLKFKTVLHTHTILFTKIFFKLQIIKGSLDRQIVLLWYHACFKEFYGPQVHPADSSSLSQMLTQKPHMNRLCEVYI